MPKPTRYEPAARFDQIWQDYAAQEGMAERVAQHATGRQKFLRVLEDYVKASAPPHVVEVGCGSAIDLCLLRHRFPGILAVGLDLSFEGIKVARGSAAQLQVPVRLCQGDAFALPFRSGSVGIVFSQGVLEHFHDPSRALAEQVRVLSAGGVLVVSVPQAFTGYTVHKRRAIRAGTWSWGWEDQYSSHRLRQLGEGLGLCVERVFGYQYWLSWGEPAWVLRDLYAKFHRRNPLAALPPFPQLDRFYNTLWNWLECRYGHLFQQNVVAVFRKPGGTR